MGGIIDEVEGWFGESNQDEAIGAQKQAAAADRAYQQQMFERQFGPVNDAMMNQLMGMLGYERLPPSAPPPPAPAPSSWMGRIIQQAQANAQPSTVPKFSDFTYTGKSPFMDKYKGALRTEIESGLRPSEEGARNMLLERIRANPRGMSLQAQSKSLKDMVREQSAIRGSAFRTGMGEAELLPTNLAMSFLNRAQINPVTSGAYPPNYTGSKIDDLKTAGEGLYGLVQGGAGLYNKYFGGGGQPAGFENYGDISNVFDENYGLT